MQISLKFAQKNVMIYVVHFAFLQLRRSDRECLTPTVSPWCHLSRQIKMTSMGKCELAI